MDAMSRFHTGQMEFVLPEAYWKDLGKAPAPVSNVELTYGEGGLVAAAYYGGYATKDEVERRSAELVEAINASEDYAVAGETYSAAYNDPFTPPWRRRNEVLVAVQQKAGAPPTRPSTVTGLGRFNLKL